MSEPRYTDAQLRELMESLSHAMCAVRGGKILVVNQAYLTLFGRLREELEGKPFDLFLPPEERRRLMERMAPKNAAGWKPPRAWNFILRQDSAGRPQRIDIHSQHLPAADEGEPYTLATLFLRAEEQNELEFAEVLVEVSAALIHGRNEADVRRLAVGCFEQKGYGAQFFGQREGALRLLDDLVPDPRWDEAYAREALATRRAIFRGASEEDLTPSQVFVPVGEGPQGVVLLIAGSRISSRHTFAIDLFAKVLGGAVINADLHASSKQRLEETELLLELARTTAQTLELSEVLGAACDSLVKLLDGSNCFILLYDEAARSLRAAAASASRRLEFENVVIHIDDPGFAATAARERRAVSATTPTTVERLSNPKMQQRFPAQAVIAFPLISRGQLLGVVVLDDTRGPREFGPEWTRFAEAVMGQLALPVANARLYDSLRQSYAEVAQARAEGTRRERMAALGELSAVVAHEVRNPLGVVFNAVSSIRRLIPEQGEARMLLDMLREEADRINRIVGDLLDFARPSHIDFQPEDLGKVIQESLDVAAAQPRFDQGVLYRFEADVEANLPRISLDRRLMRQALVNVAVNAIQAMPKGGTVRVRVLRESSESGCRLRIDLTDEGPGIPAEVRPRIFEPFFTTKAQGTGLGLAVVKRIVEDHQGDVQVSSESGRGTTFTFRLPLLETGMRSDL